MSVRILVADDHAIVLDGLRALIGKETDMEVVAEAEDGRAAVRLAEQHQPDVAILDVAMPELNGIEAARRILANNSECRIIALSMHVDRRFVVEALRAGIAGYVLKDSAFEELARAIRAVVDRQTYLSPQVADVVVEHYVRKSRGSDELPAAGLTPREREVLQLVAEGKSTRQIASDLSVSVKTVETHRQQIMKKLDLHSVAELTKFAIREGLTSLDS